MTTELTNNELQRAINWMRANERLLIPYGFLPGSQNLLVYPHVELGNESAWQEYQWNPPQYSHYTGPDTGASEKPSWNNIILAWKNQQIDDLKEQTENLLERTVQYFGDAPPPHVVRQNITDTDTINIDGVETHVHGGLDRMTALVNMVEDANEANIHIPHIVMRDESNQPIQIHTQSEIRKILQAISLRKNKVESAHNLVMQQYQAIADRRDAIYTIPSDPVEAEKEKTRIADLKLLAAEQANAFIKGYAGHLKTQMEAYNKDALPTDLETLKAVYQERIEAHALGRVKDLREVLTQQGIDLPASCNDEAEAMRKIAVAERNGGIAVNSAESVADATTAYDSAVQKINSIHALNTPTWIIQGTAYDAFHAPAVEIAGDSLTVEAEHPAVLNAADNEDLIKVMLRFTRVYNRTQDKGVAIAIRSRSTSSPKASKVQYIPQQVAIGDVIEFTLKATNLCGYSEIRVDLTIN